MNKTFKNLFTYFSMTAVAVVSLLMLISNNGVKEALGLGLGVFGSVGALVWRVGLRIVGIVLLVWFAECIIASGVAKGIRAARE